MDKSTEQNEKGKKLYIHQILCHEVWKVEVIDNMSMKQILKLIT